MDMNAFTRKLGNVVLKSKANSPHAFFALGVIGVVGGAVLACKATLKLETVLEEVTQEVEDVQTLGKRVVETAGIANYTEQDYRKDMGLVYGKSAAKIIKLYAPAILVGGVGIAALTGSHLQLTKRNTALTVTLTAVTKAYSEYRMRVQEELGREREINLYQNASEVDIEVDGKKESALVINPDAPSMYAKLFDEASPSFQKDAEINRYFIKCQQNYLNHTLKIKGHVMLNDAYDILGLDRTVAGSVVGWVYTGEGDGYVDFGLDAPSAKEFLVGREPRVWLDFNVDGPVNHLIELAQRKAL